MERYQTKDVSFVPPANWADRTVVAFATNPFPHGRKGGASIVVTRDAPPAGETLLAYAHRQLMQLRMGLSGFEVLGGLEYRVGGKPAMQLRVAWPTADGAVEQTIVHVDVARPRADGGAAPGHVPDVPREHLVRSRRERVGSVLRAPPADPCPRRARRPTVT